MWIENNKMSPPIEFQKLLEQPLDSSLLSEIMILLDKKRSGIELGLEPKIKIINDFVDSKIEYYENLSFNYNLNTNFDSNYLDKQFIEILNKEG